ncbi:MAG: hypothetical protein RBU37_20190 [Myxococcota bacterium]|nr:hypothetical protein [Myxococcota bacterium]
MDKKLGKSGQAPNGQKMVERSLESRHRLRACVERSGEQAESRLI